MLFVPGLLVLICIQPWSYWWKGDERNWMRVALNVHERESGAWWHYTYLIRTVSNKSSIDLGRRQIRVARLALSDCLSSPRHQSNECGFTCCRLHEFNFKNSIIIIWGRILKSFGLFLALGSYLNHTATSAVLGWMPKDRRQPNHFTQPVHHNGFQFGARWTRSLRKHSRKFKNPH